MKCQVNVCKREADKRCRNCGVAVCDQHSEAFHLWFTDTPERTCYPCQLKTDVLTKPRNGLKLSEILKNCLWALDSRYPNSVVKINQAVLSHQGLWTDICSPSSMHVLLYIYVPQVLDAPACLVINAQESAIYLVEESQEIPAFWISCSDCTPSYQQTHRTRAASVN
jgi:hypothetical protein